MQALSPLDRRILTGPDPFERNKVTSPWDATLQADVPSINAEQTERTLKLVEAVRSDRVTRAVLVSGQAGFGKTHLLGRVKALLRPPALFTYVTAFSDPERPYRHLLRALVASLERPLSRDSQQQLTGVVQAVSMLDRRDLASRYPGIDFDVVDALRLLGDRRRWDLARTWLTGADMDPEDLRKLGLRRTLSSEDDVARAIVTLARVLAHWGPVVIAFDQLEFLANGPAEPGLTILGNRLAWLHDEAPNLLFILSCLATTYAETNSLWRQSVRDRLAANLIKLVGLTPEQAQQLCDLRMQQLYGDDAPPWPAYPFRHEFFAELFRAGAAGPRAVLWQCSRALRELRTLGRVAPILTVAPDATAGITDVAAPTPARSGQAGQPGEVRAALRDELRKRLDEQRREPQSRRGRPPLPPEAAELARTLHLLLDGHRKTGRLLGGFAVKRVDLEPGPARGQPPVVSVHLERDGTPLHVGIAVSDTLSGQSFAHQMQALLNTLRNGRWQWGILLRDERLGVPPTWKKGHEYLQQWKDGGGAFVEADAESVARLDALRSLLAEASSGDVAPLGKPLGPDETLRHVVEDMSGEEEPGGQSSQAQAAAPGRIAALDELVDALRQLAGTPVGAGARPGPEPAPAAQPTAISLSVTGAVSALGCPRYFVLTGGRRLLGPAVFPEAAASPEAAMPLASRSSGPPSLAVGTTLHRMVAGFVACLRTAPPGVNPGLLGAVLGSLPEEDAWVAVARRRLFEPWRHAEGQNVPEQQAAALWGMVEQALRFLYRTVTEGPQGRRGGRFPWPLRARRSRAMPEIAAEVPLERTVELDEGRLLRIAGVADALVRHGDGRQTVVEFKTYPPPAEPLDLFQVALYTWLLEGQGISAEPVLVYLTPSTTQVRRFQQAAVNDVLDRKLRPFLAQLRQWAGWQMGDPTPPTTRMAELCDTCPFHPPCPEVFPLDSVGVHPPETSPSLPVEPAALEAALQQFGCDVHTTDVKVGPSFVRYLMAPESRTTVERIRARAEDLLVRLGLPAEPLVHGLSGAIAVDVALRNPQVVPLEDVLSRAAADATGGRGASAAPAASAAGQLRGLRIPLGVGIEGDVFTLDLADPMTPHLLVAGTTGSGKSNLLLAICAAAAAWYPPRHVQFLLIDPKRVTFGSLSGSPYLFRPPVQDAAEVPQAVDALIGEMNIRYARFDQAGVQSLDEGVQRAGVAMPHVVCIVDEFASLVLVSKKDRDSFERRIHEIANKGRAAGIHLILATQRPDSTVISGSIKNNLTARIALKVGDRISSEVILGQPGAQALAGPGEMLFSAGSGQPVRLQGPYVTLDAVRRWLQVPLADPEATP